MTTMSILRFLYQTLCAFLQIKDRKHIEQNFHSVAGVMPQGWDLVVGSKAFAWGFAMTHNRLCILVYSIKRVVPLIKLFAHIYLCMYLKSECGF